MTGSYEQEKWWVSRVLIWMLSGCSRGGISEEIRWLKHDFHWREESEDSSVWSGLISPSVTQTQHDLLNRQLLLSIYGRYTVKGSSSWQKVVIRPEQVCVSMCFSSDPKSTKLKDEWQLWSRWDLGRIWWENSIGFRTNKKCWMTHFNTQDKSGRFTLI